MLSQNQIRHVRALHARKYRDEYRQFLAEGHKLVSELLNSHFRIENIYADPAWIVENIPALTERKIPVFETIPREMERITALSTPSPVLAVAGIPDPLSVNDFRREESVQEELVLALDDIRDPGNLGTILRIADWFGIGTILCSESCVELYNPKVVQATMGSIVRVKVIRCNLAEALGTLSGCTTPSGCPVYGAFLDGESVFAPGAGGHGILVIGNESHGISGEVAPFITHRISIPSFGHSPLGKAESLNASVATAIICAEFRRKKINY